MRTSVKTLNVVLAGMAIVAAMIASQAQAETRLDSFAWPGDTIKMAMTVDGQPVKIRKDVAAGEDVTEVTEDLTTVEFKSYKEPRFLAIAVSSDNSDTGEIFLLECPTNTNWVVMNLQPIRARKLELMKDFVGIVEDFKKVSNFGIAQSFRKTAEYFETNPNARLQDLQRALETGDQFVKTLPKPHITPGATTAGVEAQPIPDSQLAQTPQPQSPAQTAQVPDDAQTTQQDQDQYTPPRVTRRTQQPQVTRRQTRRQPTYQDDENSDDQAYTPPRYQNPRYQYPRYQQPQRNYGGGDPFFGGQGQDQGQDSEGVYDPGY